MNRRRSIAAVTALFVLAGLPAASVAAAGPRSEHARVIAHWTEARMRAAQPRDFIRVSDGTFKPAARPPSGNGKPGGGGGGTDVSGASWPNGQGLVYKATGKVFFDMSGGSWVCSGAVAQDGRTGYSLVLTAAHCAYDEAADVFATNWMFIPQYDSNPTTSCASTAFGCWTASGLVVHNGYAAEESFTDEATWHDFAFAIVGPGGKSNGQLDTAVGGSFPIAFTGYAENTRMYAFGYPAAGRYKGKDLTYCAGPVFFDPYNSEKTYGMTCNMTGGSSGGPWFSSFTESSGTGTLSSLNSYGYSGITAMHGPKFNATTQAVFDRANTTSGSSIVP